MSNWSIVVENVSKTYVIGGVKELAYNTLRDSIASLFRGRVPAARRELIHALSDVSFSASEGEVVGIIGRNGAGKSTLLKVLSRITAPTSGRARLRGRIGSLLEVGTGFHPELTGRENIFLNGAILGMKRAEIARKLDEIVAFAEIEQFLDTPVKRFSSGMYVRLAFAVAAHLDTDILVVDEVLAVGDASFQRKCLSMMEDAGRHGRTVLFVSHNLASVTRLCRRALLLDRGSVLADGAAGDVVRFYLQSDIGTSAERDWPDRAMAPGDDIVRLSAVRVRSEGAVAQKIDAGSPVEVEIEWDVLVGGHALLPSLRFQNHEGVVLFTSSPDVEPSSWRREIGRYVSAARIPGDLLGEGMIVVGASIGSVNLEHIHVDERQVVTFEVVDMSGRGQYRPAIGGVIRPLLEWSDARLPPA